MVGMFSFTYPEEKDAYLTVYVKNCQSLTYENGVIIACGVDEFSLPVYTALHVGECTCTLADTCLPNPHLPEEKVPAKAITAALQAKEVTK